MLRYADTLATFGLCPDPFVPQGFLGLIVSNPTSIAAFDYPDSLTELCDARPSTVSIDATEAGRKRSEADSLARVMKRGVTGHSHWSKKRMIRHRL